MSDPRYAAWEKAIQQLLGTANGMHDAGFQPAECFQAFATSVAAVAVVTGVTPELEGVFIERFSDFLRDAFQRRALLEIEIDRHNERGGSDAV